MSRHLVWNATAYDGRPSGASSRAVCLIAGRLELGDTVTVVVPRGVSLRPAIEDELADGAPLDRFGETGVDVDPARPLQRAVFSERRLLRALPPSFDALVTDYYPVPRRCADRTVVTVHDLRHMGPDAVGGQARRAWFRMRFPGLLRRAGAVVVPTRAIADELVSRTGLSDAVVVPNVVGAAWREERPVSSPRDRLVVVGAADGRKSIRTVLDALVGVAADVRVPLRVVGRTSAELEALLAGARDHGIDVRATGELSDAELVAEVDRAVALLHPSRYEGFGLPVVEAMARGTRVIAADDPAVREVAGGHARLLHAGDTEAWSQAIEEALAGPHDASGLAAAREHALGFDRRRAARALGEALDRLPGPGV